MKVYWGITASRSYRASIPADEPVMISAGGLWTGYRFMRKRHWPWLDFILDSGGFIALNKWGDYPYTFDQYLSLVDSMKPTWAASMDYPCEPDIARGTKLSTQERIAATVDSAVYLSGRDDRVVPVLQGFTAEEYEQCWKLLSSRMKVSRLAIGSICKRQSKKDIGVLCWQLRQFLPDIPIHGFGVKIKALERPEPWALFSSIDTNAWEFYRRDKKLHGQILTDQDAFISYSGLIGALKDKPRQIMLGSK